MAEFIKRDDSLNEGREKINKSIQDAEDAKNTANDADQKADQALSNSESTQEQLDQVVIEGDSSVEAAQARVDTDGNSHQTLKERLDTEHSEVTSQLAQRANFEDYEIQNKTRKPEALFTIIDDDGKRALLDYLRPLQQEFNIPMTTAIITDWVKNGNSEAITEQELLQLYNEGWEVLSHTASHARLDALSQAEQEQEMQDSLAYLESIGINDVTAICYPFSDHNDDTVLAGRKFFRSGRTTDYGINRPPFQTWDIMAINGEGKQHTLESLKAEIDDISENGGWGVYITHAGPDNDPTLWARDIIEYVLSKGNIEFVTYNEALNRMGNIIDSGRYWDDDKSKPHFVVGSDGSSSSHTSPDIFMHLPYRSVKNNDKPSSFPKDKIVYTTVSGSDGFTQSGLLMTDRTFNNYAYQQLKTVTNVVRTRWQKEGLDEWGKWQDDNIVITTHDLVTNDTPITDFENNKITFTQVSATDGFPDDAILETNRLLPSNAGFQILRSNNTSDTRYVVYERRWLGGAWEGWKKQPRVFSSTSYYYRNSFSFNHVTQGDMYFNETLNQPMYVNATKDGFIDAMGNPISL